LRGCAFSFDVPMSVGNRGTTTPGIFTCILLDKPVRRGEAAINRF
jgi:hypothetical protein